METKVPITCPDHESRIFGAFKQIWLQYDFPDVALADESDRRLKTQRDFSTVTLVTEDGQALRAHQIVLEAASTLFKEMLSKSNHPDPIIFLTNVKQETLKQLLMLVYRGECMVEKEEVALVQKTADVLGFTWLHLEMDQDAFSEESFERGQVTEHGLDVVEDQGGSGKEVVNKIESEVFAHHSVQPVVGGGGGRNPEFQEEQFKSPSYEISNKEQTFSSESTFHNSDHLFEPVVIETPGNDDTSLAGDKDAKEIAEVKNSSHEDTSQNTGQQTQDDKELESTGVTCKECGKKYNILRSLKMHIQSVHEKKRFHCDECDHSSTQIGSLKMHKQVAHLLLRHYCDQCDYQATTKSLLKQHKRFKHDKVVFSCDQCEYEGGSKHKLTQHMAKHEGAKVECPMCDFRASKSHIKKHIKSIHEGFTYQCPQCDFTASFQQSITVHKQRVHEKRLYSCNICDYKIPSQTSLRRHKESVHEKIRYSCHECNFKTARKSFLANHRKAHSHIQ